jgi:hypothetical protein
MMPFFLIVTGIYLTLGLNLFRARIDAPTAGQNRLPCSWWSVRAGCHNQRLGGLSSVAEPVSVLTLLNGDYARGVIGTRV